MKNKITAVVFVSALFSSTVFAGTAVHKKVTKERVSDLNARTVFLEKQMQALQDKVDKMEYVEKSTTKGNPDLHTLVELYAHGPAVVTSPALGVRRSAEGGEDLMVSLPSINEDLVLLQVRQKMDNYATENNIPIPERPIIALSGSVSGEIDLEHGYGVSKKTDVNLSGAELDVVGEASPWVTGAMIFSYDDAATKGDRRVNNSRVQIDRGWVTVGQLNKFPLYLSIGQMSAPFGNFGSDMIKKTPAKALGKLKDRMVVLGAYWEGLQAQAYGFAGEIKGDRNVFEHTGFNLGYDYTKDKFKLSVGGSILGNFAETDRMQSEIFAQNGYSSNEKLNHNVCGVDGRIKIGYHPFTLRAEYVGAIKSFHKDDISFNGEGAQPQAFNVEGSVEFNIMNKPNNFAAGYGHTWKALALGLPRDAFFTEYDVSLIKNTILSLEYRHEINYGWNDQAAGRGGVKQAVDGVGRHKNIVAAQLAVYF